MTDWLSPETWQQHGKRIGLPLRVALYLVFIAFIVLALLLINQLPTLWHTFQNFQRVLHDCLESRPPSATIVEWFEHYGECATIARKASAGKP